MGSSACNYNVSKTTTLLWFFHQVSQSHLPKSIEESLQNQITKKINLNTSNNIYQYLKISIHTFQQLENEKKLIQEHIKQLKNCLKQDEIKHTFSNFCIDYKLMNFSKLSEMNVKDLPDYAQDLLILFKTVKEYCQNVQQFMVRVGKAYQVLFYSLLWEQFNNNLKYFEEIYDFSIINDHFESNHPNFQYKLTLKHLFYKLWGNQIKCQVIKEEIETNLFLENSDSRQYFNMLINIAFNEYQNEFSSTENKYSSQLQEQLLSCLQTLILNKMRYECKEDFTQIRKFLSNIEHFQFQLSDSLKSYYNTQVFQYVNEIINSYLKAQFRDTKKYIVEKALFLNDDSILKTIAQSINQQENYTSIDQADCKTTCQEKSILVNQHQKDTIYYNSIQQKWCPFNEINEIEIKQLFEFCELYDQIRKCYQKNIHNNTLNFYCNVILDYTHQNSQSDICELLMQYKLQRI